MAPHQAISIIWGGKYFVYENPRITTTIQALAQQDLDAVLHWPPLGDDEEYFVTKLPRNDWGFLVLESVEVAKIKHHEHKAEKVQLDRIEVLMPTLLLDFENETATYWSYVNFFPYRFQQSRKRVEDAIQQAEEKLTESLLYNFVNRSSLTTFSQSELEFYLNIKPKIFPSTPSTPDLLKDESTCHQAAILSTYILFNEYSVKDIKKSSAGRPPTHFRLLYYLSLVIFLGMLPMHPIQFEAALNRYRASRQLSNWKSFLESISKERQNMNVVAGLLLAGSLAFVAIQDITGLARFLSMGSIAISLGCIVVGFNPSIDEKLAELSDFNPGSKETQSLFILAKGLDEHLRLLILSIFLLFSALLAYEVQGAVSANSSARIFFILGALSLSASAGYIILWNVYYSDRGEATLEQQWGIHEAHSKAIKERRRRQRAVGKAVHQ